MKIVQIITRSDNIGGAQTHVMDLAKELQKQGNKVEVIVGGNGVFIDQLINKGVKVHPIPYLIRSLHPLNDLRAVFEIRKLLKDIQPNVVATHSSKAGILGRIAAWSLHIPSVFTAHGWAFTEGVPKFKQIFYLIVEKIAGSFTNKVITVSDYDRMLSQKHRVVPLYKVNMIHNGVSNIPISNVTQSTDNPTFIMTARLEKPKNHIFLLQALSKLKDKRWQVYFIGDGRLRLDIEYWIKKLELKNKVHLLGERTDVIQQLQNCDGFILISDWEGLPISILEGMRAGLPIIASDVGGVSELVTDDVNGFLIPKGNKEMLISKLSLLIQNKELRERLGKASRKKYENQFSLPRMIEQTVLIYQEVSNAKES